MSALEAEPASRYHETCHHRTYYMTCAEYDELWATAHGCCQICRLPEADAHGGKLCIDHLGDYGYHMVRGLLCHKCNALMRRVDDGSIRFPGARVIDYQYNAWCARRMMGARGFSRARGRWVWPSAPTSQKGV